MIKLDDRIKKAYGVLCAVNNELLKLELDFDGVIGVFNDGIEEGSVIKIYDTFNPNIDLCIWCYLPSDREANNQIKILVGHHSDCANNNMWLKELPSKIFTQAKARELHKEAREYILNVIASNVEKLLKRKD